MLVITSFVHFSSTGHAWLHFRVQTRWKCFTQNTIFKLNLKIYEFSLKFHAERMEHKSDQKLVEPSKAISSHSSRLAPMWQQSGTLLFDSCYGIAGFLVDELQIWIWRYVPLEVLPKTLIFFFNKNESFLLEMRSNIEYSCHTVTNIIHG